MKSKFILAAAFFVVASYSSFAATSPGVTEKKSVPAVVVRAFNSDFSPAGKVTWEAGAGYFKAGYADGGLIRYAFYTTSGELMGTGRQLTPDMITVGMANQLKKEYFGYTISEAYEIGEEKSGDYFFVLQNGSEQIRLRSNDAGKLAVVR